MRFTVTRTSTAPPERVYEVFTDLERLPDRIEAIKTLEPTEPGESLKIADGRSFRETRVLFGKDATEVMTAHDVSPSGYTLSCNSCNCDYRFTHTFTPAAGGGTTIEMTGVGTPLTLGAKILSVVFFPMRGVMVKHCTKDLETLIAAAETPEG